MADLLDADVGAGDGLAGGVHDVDRQVGFAVLLDAGGGGRPPRVAGVRDVPIARLIGQVTHRQRLRIVQDLEPRNLQRLHRCARVDH